jgi:hypothetical protein
MDDLILFDAMRTDKRINRLSQNTQLFYIKLVSAVDDTFRYFAHPARLRAGLYPFKIDQVTEEDMQAYLDEIIKAGLVKTYWVDDEPYLELSAFQEAIFAARHPSEFPAPEEGHPITALGGSLNHA